MYEDEILNLKTEVSELRSMVNELRQSESSLSVKKMSIDSSERKMRKLETSPSVIKIQIE